jgi:hypothetical protein
MDKNSCPSLVVRQVPAGVCLKTSAMVSVTKTAGLGKTWCPRELRHTFLNCRFSRQTLSTHHDRYASYLQQ